MLKVLLARKVHKERKVLLVHKVQQEHKAHKVLLALQELLVPQEQQDLQVLQAFKAQ